jgi:hypothetical protein
MHRRTHVCDATSQSLLATLRCCEHHDCTTPHEHTHVQFHVLLMLLLLLLLTIVALHYSHALRSRTRDDVGSD